ncbi:MAG: sensor histidine kinase [Firmicutes bacterium]|nr:sensor histidine kinase [Bacillota bacterium]
MLNINPLIDQGITTMFVLTVPAALSYVIVKRYLPDGRRILESLITYIITTFLFAIVLYFGYTRFTSLKHNINTFLTVVSLAFILSISFTVLKFGIQYIMRMALDEKRGFRSKIDELNHCLSEVDEDLIAEEVFKQLEIEGIFLIAENQDGLLLRKAAGRYSDEHQEQTALENYYFSAINNIDCAEFLPGALPAEVFVPVVLDNFKCGIFFGHRCSHVKLTHAELQQLNLLGYQIGYRLKMKYVTKHLSEELNSMAQSVLQQQQWGRGLRVINRLLFRSFEDERKALAREIHDGPLQLSLDASRRLKQVLEECSSDAPNLNNISVIRDIIQELNYELREVCANLRPSILSDLGLVVAAEAMCKQVMLNEILKVSLSVNNIDKNQRLAEEVELGAFRLLQEGITNAVKHSGAVRVEVGIALVDNNLELMVEDNGRGFDINGLDDWTGFGEHFGIIGMRERVEGLGGNFAIESKRGSGVKVRASIPIG